MEGRTDPGVKNYLRFVYAKDRRAELVELGPVMESLQQHRGWELLEGIVEELRERGEDQLRRLAHETALGGDPKAQVAYAQKAGVQNGLVFHRDVVASVIDAAKKAADELKKAAQREADAAERS